MFFQNADAKSFRNVFKQYEQVLKKKAETKTKHKAKEDLIVLDKW